GDFAVLFAGGPADAEGTDYLTVDHDRHASFERGELAAADRRGSFQGQAQVHIDVLFVRFGAGFTADQGGRLGFGHRRVAAPRPGTVHPTEVQQVPAVVDDGNIHLQLHFLGLLQGR